MNTTKAMSAKNIILFAFISTISYIVFFFITRFFGLLHVTGLSMINYVLFCTISFYRIKQLLKDREQDLSFFKIIGSTFFTGAFSFLMFGFFIFIYSKIDRDFVAIYLNITDRSQQLVPFFLLFFEGSGASVIVSLIVGMYGQRLKDKK